MPDRSKTPNGRYLITMALPYANGDIHLGHLVEAVQADVFVRFQKLRGNDAVYICADDTHGTPIEINALAKGVSPRELIADVWERHVRDYHDFDIDFDLFYSTDSPENRRYAELIFERLRSSGLVVERELEQYYCEQDGRFLPDRFVVGICPKCGASDQYGDVCEVCGATYDSTEIVEPRCRLCSNPPIRRSSKHLFVDLQQAEDFLHEYVNSDDVLQRDIRGFVNNWIKDGLRQWCISRDGPYFGFEIPGYPGKYFYVWLDAPIGYLSSTAKWCTEHGRTVEEFWGPESDAHIVHFIGKDIVYFHTLFWPVMLRSARFALPKRFYIHGFLTVEGEKMSKSRGTFILARRYLERVRHPLAAEYLRFYYAAKLAGTSGDIDLSISEFCSRINTTLVNNIGNLHHRTFVFAERRFDGELPDVAWDESIETAVREAADAIAREYENADYKSVIERTQALGSLGNKYYQDNAPWEYVKTDRERAARTIVTCANLVRALLVFIKPIVPGIVRSFEEQLGVSLTWADHQFGLRGGSVGKAAKLVAPIEPSAFDELLGEAPPPAEEQHEDEEVPTIGIDDFTKVDLRVATVEHAERLPKSNKLLRLRVDVGGEKRQVMAGIAQHYAPDDLIGKQVVVVANLAPAKLMGQVSEAMLLAASDNGKLVIVQPQRPVTSGAQVA